MSHLNKQSPSGEVRRLQSARSSHGFFVTALILVWLACRVQVYAIDVSDVFYGTGAGASTTGGVNDSAFGYAAFHTNTTGSDNTAMGTAALYSNTNGYENTATG